MSVFDLTRQVKKVIPITAVPVEKKNTICALPWTHLAFEPSGRVVPCCLTSTHNYFAGDLNVDSIDQIWNSDNMKQLRSDMVSGKEPEICNKCFSREAVTGESARIYHNKNFSDVVKKIPSITLEDGTCTEMNLKYWDFRFSNLCNFKCRSCGPRYSSAWVPDANKLSPSYSVQEKVWNIDINFDFLKDQIKNVREIYFAGGEPLLMPEHWQILDMLVEHKRFDVRISYNINASVLTYGKKNIIDYWSQWQPGKVRVWPSIDEIGDRAELIRSGTVWPKVEDNLRKLSKIKNIDIRPGITVGAWNVNRLPEIITHLDEIGIGNFFINLIEQPDYYHVNILPDEFKKATIEKLTAFIATYNRENFTDISKELTHILHELTKPTDLYAVKRFLEKTRDLDALRNEDTYKVIPEMQIIRDTYGYLLR